VVSFFYLYALGDFGMIHVVGKVCDDMFFRVREKEASRNFVQNVSRISWHFSSLMAVVSILLNTVLHREFKRAVFQVLHKIRHPGKAKGRRSRLKYIREAKEIVGALWAVGLGLWAVLGLLGSLIGKFRRKK